MSNTEFRGQNSTGNETISDNATQLEELSRDVEEILYSLSREHARSGLPTIIYIAILMVFGLAVNAVVFVVYYKRFPSTATRCFILSLSAIGFTASALCCPGEIADLCTQYTFDNPWLCRAFRTLKAVLTLTSAFLLVALAAYRHSTVCSRKTWTTKDARLAVGTCVMLAAFISTPVAVLSGRQTANTNFQNVSGFRCSVDDAHVGSAFQLVHNVVMATACLSGVIVIIVLYIRVARHVVICRRHSLGRRTVVRVCEGSLACNISLVMPRSGFHVILSTLLSGAASDDADGVEEKNAARGEVQKTIRKSRLTCQSLDICRSQSGLTAGTSPSDPLAADVSDEVTASTLEKQKAVIASLMKRNEDLKRSQDRRTRDSEGRDLPRASLESLDAGRPSSPTPDVSEQISFDMETSEEVVLDDGSEDEYDEQTGCTHVQWLCPSLCCQNFWRSLVCLLFTSRNTATSNENSNTGSGAKKKRTASPKSLASRTKLTLVFLIVFSCVSYLPFLVLSNMRAVGLIAEDPVTSTMHSVCNLLIRSYFISFTANSFVHSICSSKFRRRCRLLFSSRK